MLASRHDLQTLIRLAIALAGACLLFSPHVLAAPVVSTAAWSAWGFGLVIVTVSLSAGADPRPWSEWLLAAGGAATIVAPGVFGFAGPDASTWIHGMVGGAVITLAALSLWQIRAREAPRPA